MYWRKVSKVIGEHKDWLTHFNYMLYDRYFNSLSIRAVIVEDTLPKFYEAGLVEDIMSLVASSSSYENKKLSSKNDYTHLTMNYSCSCGENFSIDLVAIKNYGITCRQRSSGKNS